MKVVGQRENCIYSRQGFNMNMVNSGTSVNMDMIYSYMQETKKSAGELSRQEYLMFRKSLHN